MADTVGGGGGARGCECGEDTGEERERARR